MLTAFLRAEEPRLVDQIQVSVTFPKISPDNLDKFKALAGEALKIAADEPGVLQYDWFFNADETVCRVRETFADSEAVLTHLDNVGEILGPVAQLGGGIEIEMYGGSPSDELLQTLAMFRPAHYPYFQGK